MEVRLFLAQKDEMWKQCLQTMNEVERDAAVHLDVLLEARGKKGKTFGINVTELWSYTFFDRRL